MAVILELHIVVLETDAELVLVHEPVFIRDLKMVLVFTRLGISFPVYGHDG